VANDSFPLANRYPRPPWGDSFAIGGYGYTGGGALEEEDDIGEIDDQSPSQDWLEPSLRTSISSTPTPSTNLSNSSTHLDEEEDVLEDIENSQTRRGKRARESGPPSLRKKIRSYGFAAMDKIGEGILAIAEAIGQPLIQETKESVGATMQGQAQEKIQE
jgi:hypothetical protein